MTQAVARGWSRWIAGAAGAALGFLVTMVFGQDSALVAQGKQAFNDHGCYGCRTLGRRQARTTPAVSCGPGAPTQAQRESAQGGSMAENEHPKGALLFILVFLVLVVLFWINTYMRLWLRY